MERDLVQRKKEIISFLQKNKTLLGYVGLVIILLLGFWLRISNLSMLIDVDGEYVPVDPDSAAFFRYSKYILENGKLMELDLMRYYPFGFAKLDEFNFLSQFIVYLYKFLHFFNSTITFGYASVISPAIFFCIALIFFYLLVQKLFDFRVALLASAFLTVMPDFLFRTVAGVFDKESLAIVFFFASLYFYVLAIKSNHKYGYLHGISSGIFTSLLGAVWGGVNFIFLIIGITTLLKVILNNLSKREFYAYAGWWFSTFLLLRTFYRSYYGFKAILISFTSQITLIALGGGLIYLLIKEYNIFNLREKLNKYPIGILSIFLLAILGVVFFPLFFSVFLYGGGLGFFISYFYTKFTGLFLYLLKPFSQDIFVKTVVENQSTYFNNWMTAFGFFFFLAMLAASIVLFYQMFKDLKKRKWTFVFYYTIFLLVFFISKSSLSPALDGQTLFSRMLFLGAISAFLILFSGYFIYGFYKERQYKKIETIEGEEQEHYKKLKNDKQLYEIFMSVPFNNLFLLMWFFITAFTAVDLLRLVFIFVPIASIFVAFLIVNIYDFYYKTEDKLTKFFCFLTVYMLVFFPFIAGSLAERSITGIKLVDGFRPEFNPQWQTAMKFVRENTPKESVFSHWWDYGYWIQAFGERATLTDGGNARGEINHLIARHLFMGQNREEVLELLKSHNATHLLISHQELGKYFVISKIGSNETSDLDSSIPAFLAGEPIKGEESENGEVNYKYLYDGEFNLDEDLIAAGKFFPKNSAVARGVILPVRTKDNKILAFGQPQIVILYNGELTEVPLNCVFFNGASYLFNEYGYDGCFRIVPMINSNSESNTLGIGLFLSPSVKNTAFAQLFLFDKNKDSSEEWKGFEKIYDEATHGFDLVFLTEYNDFFGSIKIWKLSYDEDIKTNPTYLRTGVDY